MARIEDARGLSGSPLACAWSSTYMFTPTKSVAGPIGLTGIVSTSCSSVAIRSICSLRLVPSGRLASRRFVCSVRWDSVIRGPALW